MDEPVLSTTSSEPTRIIEDCVDYFNRRETDKNIYRDRANGDDAGHVEPVEETEKEEPELDA